MFPPRLVAQTPLVTSCLQLRPDDVDKACSLVFLLFYCTLLSPGLPPLHLPALSLQSHTHTHTVFSLLWQQNHTGAAFPVVFRESVGTGRN